MRTEQQLCMWSPVGILRLTARGERLTGIVILAGTPGRCPDLPPDACGHPVLAASRAQLDDYFAGRRREFRLPLAFSGLPEFTARILQLLQAVPYGETVGYAELAARAGSPGAARAVGRAMAANPWPIVVPCHRVIGAGGRLGGYSGGCGLPTKAWLLDFERRHCGLPAVFAEKSA